MPEFDASLAEILVTALLAYLAGSIPFGLLVSRAFGLPDPRSIGSGNIGATNVLRTGSRAAALTTLLLDAAKGLVAVLAARTIAGEDAAQMAGLAAFLGHVFSVWLGFRGGKGVATLLGALAGFSALVGLAAMATWLGVFLVSRISSLSALVAAALAPGVALLLGHGQLVVATLFMAIVVFWSHRANVRRLIDGTEPRVTRREP
ncbi:MAG: glycerol-3-phosphate 1-O-acyltransferase PlsY [Boseongicola sp. SB0664_bin_43]|uniref:Glycerol-3-phosphate acyltransferase n=1 Tax=Boseongicola sp. SB0664_bin_43 TaxID=2604844 RepID=A0A6B0Y156_9RHOB|nr:glycerol-3-phosphate 1-O-acyltransferase PlsY [Boseongicola sp. SB0664_bin_43]MYK31332.1 glycerol-3-phosphate 1-O-acyltransferase PlsY [Boseongicola sp. SB0670_bin_30]